MQSLSTWLSIEYSFKKVLVNLQFTVTIFKIFLFEDRSVLWSAQQVTRPKCGKISIKNKKKITVEITVKVSLKNLKNWIFEILKFL